MKETTLNNIESTGMAKTEVSMDGYENWKRKYYINPYIIFLLNRGTTYTTIPALILQILTKNYAEIGIDTAFLALLVSARSFSKKNAQQYYSEKHPGRTPPWWLI